MGARVRLNMTLEESIAYYKDREFELQVEAEQFRQIGDAQNAQACIDDMLSARRLIERFERQLAEKQSAERRAA